MGRFEIPLFDPVMRSVSSSISFIISLKFMNFFPLQCKNSPCSDCPLISCSIRGRLVTIPLPRGRKSLMEIKIRSESMAIFANPIASDQQCGHQFPQMNKLYIMKNPQKSANLLMSWKYFIISEKSKDFKYLLEVTQINT